MSPATYDLTIYCGTTVDAATTTFIYRVAGELVNLTDYKGRCQARGKKGLLFDLTTENGGILLGGVAGSIVLLMSDAQTSSLWSEGLTAQKTSGGLDVYVGGRWDLELISPSGRVSRLMHGRLLLSPEVTK